MKKRAKQQRQKSQLRTIDTAAQAQVKGGWSIGVKAPYDVATGQSSGKDDASFNDLWSARQ
jgi:hypothetical protein